MAKAQQQQGNVALAIKNYTLAAKLNQRDIEFNFSISKVLYVLQDYKGALDIYEKTDKLKGKYVGYPQLKAGIIFKVAEQTDQETLTKSDKELGARTENEISRCLGIYLRLEKYGLEAYNDAVEKKESTFEYDQMSKKGIILYASELARCNRLNLIDETKLREAAAGLENTKENEPYLERAYNILKALENK